MKSSSKIYIFYVLLSKTNIIIFDLTININFSGKPGTDYPILGAVPYTNFYCDEQAYPGFFADMETRCQGNCDKIICTTNKQECLWTLKDVQL